jgi:hypothetical protein
VSSSLRLSYGLIMWTSLTQIENSNNNAKEYLKIIITVEKDNYQKDSKTCFIEEYLNIIFPSIKNTI